MLSCSSHDLAISHDPDPTGDDVFAILGGHLDVHSSPVAFELRGHVNISHSVPEAADFSFMGVYCSSELVNAVVSLSEPLVGNCC